jgi:ATPase subunit of ABC transporter with duplicated ATPase domains
MITLKNVTLRRSAKVLLDGASVTINPGEKVGLVGRNGAGKSTLFALLNGTLHEDGGDFFDAAAVAHGAGGAGHAGNRARARPSSSSRATRAAGGRRPKCNAAEAATTASAWRTPTWRCTTPARTTLKRAPRR